MHQDKCPMLLHTRGFSSNFILTCLKLWSKGNLNTFPCHSPCRAKYSVPMSCSYYSSHVILRSHVIPCVNFKMFIHLLFILYSFKLLQNDFFRVPPWENDLGHWSQGKGLSPVWVLLWVFRWPPSENDLGHWSQGKRFSPVWILLFFSDHHLEKMTWDIDHKEKVSHQYGFFCATLNYHLEKITLCIDHKEKVQNNLNFFIKCPITNFF